jgi:hypothetical protein
VCLYSHGLRVDVWGQVYDSYGKKCNSRFLLNYGFAVEVNRDPDGQCHNEVRFMFSLLGEEDDPFRDSKLSMLCGNSACVPRCRAKRR